MTPNRKLEIERLTMRVLDKYHIKDNPGKHLETICIGERISLLDHKGWDKETCGRLMQIDGENVIFYNAQHTKEMQAFTIAHELGHYFLHHLDDSEPEIICLNRDFHRMDDSNDARLQREVEANYFAGCLLMPIDQLHPVFSQFMDRIGRGRVLYVDTQQCNFLDYKRCIYAIQMYFLASGSAIRFRLIKLGWMQFNIHFEPDEDRGISIAAYLRKNNIDM